MSIVRENLMKDKDYRPYCGNPKPRNTVGGCDNTRTNFDFIANQFICPHCGWASRFEESFIAEYLDKHFGGKLTFGLTDKNIAIIEKHIGKFEGALFTHSIWIDIAKEIGWDALTACLHYFKHLERKNRNGLLDENIGKLFYENAETIIVSNKPMLYTVGDSLVYDKLFGVINSTPMKLGKSNRYAGGTCFVSYEDAKAAIERISVLDTISKYKAYGLDCGLENTYELDGLLLLLTDTELIKLND